MEYVALGNSSINISRIGFGCEPLGGCDWGPIDEDELQRAIHSALDNGINFFDTADVYGLGNSELNLARILGPRRHDVVIATKCGVRWSVQQPNHRAQTTKDLSPHYLITAVDASLTRLQVDCIPLYQMHWPDTKTPIEETMYTLAKLQKLGKINHIGCSNFDLKLIKRAHAVSRLASVQINYNLLNNKLESGFFDFCKNEKISVLAYGVLNQGMLSGKYDTNSLFAANDRRSRLEQFQGAALVKNLETVNRLKLLANKYQKTASQLAINWTIDNQWVDCAITGIKTVSQLNENIAALGWKIKTTDKNYLVNEENETL